MRSSWSRRESPHVSDSPSGYDRGGDRHEGANNVARSDEEENEMVRGGESDSNEEYVPSGDEKDEDNSDGERYMDEIMGTSMDSSRKPTHNRGATGSEVLSTVTRTRKPVRIPAPRTAHASRGDWIKYVQTNMTTTQQVLAVKTTLNRKLREQAVVVDGG
ncbi:hypothetical protein BBJ28_00016987 [Nothophytophthora sp. Chile5]|nr:hypothetical protein BBJ28_00016987 [Nothophytophthora sp. Chile5]